MHLKKNLTKLQLLVSTSPTLISIATADTIAEIALFLRQIRTFMMRAQFDDSAQLIGSIIAGPNVQQHTGLVLSDRSSSSLSAVIFATMMQIKLPGDLHR